ncbi:MAG: adenylosuccinate synthase [Zetaproteobacteria bacterium]|nr:MAG: adenylosuccinate synthase [Zetaproteobacteria bacterium]
MGNIIALGAQWGDEGKGKVVDLLAARMEVVVRFQGGPNAGHTLIIGGARTVLHHIPSGILHPGTLCLIGSGTVLDPEKLSEEIAQLRSGGIEPEGRLRIAERCQLILPSHRMLDEAREAGRRGGRPLGTTGCGIGPAYEDKAGRRGIRLADLAQPEAKLLPRVRALLDYHNHQLRYYGADPVALEAVEAVLNRARAELLPLACDLPRLLRERMASGARILFEGAQGAMLDIDHGTYPFVTSSSTVAGGALSGTGVGPAAIGQVLGIAKAYATRVGEGPFPTELYDGEQLRDPAGARMADVGREFGATTGRLRRTGWFDAVAVRHAVCVNGMTGLALTKLDVLDGFEEVRICDGYLLDGTSIDRIPPLAEEYGRCRPHYRTLPGWRCSTYGLTDAAALPERARDFIAAIEELCGVPVVLLSTGPDREQVITLRPDFFA